MFYFAVHLITGIFLYICGNKIVCGFRCAHRMIVHCIDTPNGGGVARMRTPHCDVREDGERDLEKGGELLDESCRGWRRHILMKCKL